MALDNRIKYTKDVIHNSFIELLRKRKLNEITVTDICSNAGINRATFYRYYENQYDLLSNIQNQMLNEINESLKDVTTIDNLITTIFKMFYDKKEEWILLLDDELDSRFIKKIYNLFNEYFKIDNFSKEGKMRYLFLSYGLSGMFDYWIKNGMQETPEAISNYAIKFRNDLINNK